MEDVVRIADVPVPISAQPIDLGQLFSTADHFRFRGYWHKMTLSGLSGDSQNASVLA